jgi:AraC family transcriptional regulator of adaptative response / DNA-3-methyladenine glycosylase II
MDMDHDACYRAIAARDARFDGVFFVGVTTTGIYCRPVCPARTPGRDRCRFFATAAAAERDRFRPCLRCRPELAPGHAPVDANGRLARGVAARIEAGALNDNGGVESLAGEFGLSSRQLRRVVRQELGVSPVQLAQTHRLLLAKQLLGESHLRIIDVAFASGFGSVRRFNALFRSHYGLSPAEVRRTARPAPAGTGVRLTLAYRPPLAWDELLGFLAARAIAGVECAAAGRYWRTARVAGHRGWLAVAAAAGRNALAVEFPATLVPVIPALLARVRHLFDLNARPDVIAAHLACDTRLGPTVRQCPGLRVPGAFDGFEMAVRAVLGQQISVRAAQTLAGRFAAALGEAIETPLAGLDRVTPTPERIADAGPGVLSALGVTRARADCLRTLARAVADGRVRLEPGPDPVAALGRLQELPGIGPWTAQYIAMRALRWPDAFPDGDLGLLRAAGETSARRLRAAAEAWRPWRAYAAIHLWRTLKVRADLRG